MWSHTAGRWQSWYLNPGLSDTKIHQHASSGVMVPLQQVHHIALVPGVNLKIRQRIPSYFFSVFLWTESAGVRHLSLSQLRTWVNPTDLGPPTVVDYMSLWLNSPAQGCHAFWFRWRDVVTARSPVPKTANTRVWHCADMDAGINTVAPNTHQ